MDNSPPKPKYNTFLTVPPSIQIKERPNLERLLKVGSISKTEKAFLDQLQRELGIQIHRQVKFSNILLLDGELEGFKIAIEFDGPQNHQNPAKKEKDRKRDETLTKKGYSIYRLQWFDQIPFNLWQKEINKQAKIAAQTIKILMSLQIKKKAREKAQIAQTIQKIQEVQRPIVDSILDSIFIPF